MSLNIKVFFNLEIRGEGEDHPDYSIIKIGQNTEKNPGDLRRLSVTQIPLRSHQLMLRGNSLGSKIIITIVIIIIMPGNKPHYIDN